ncbi:hypothetical protein SORBI_3007G167950 [Sorghum bicolor]|uniref:Uncharacterized protein n=1 Tax=Sorghum bicolor TaxID=4558 RepID=A0A1Z5RAG9_SORBI|nr:hypothetical protein SORBI_3007G167950 [Sorghum bicolor]
MPPVVPRSDRIVRRTAMPPPTTAPATPTLYDAAKIWRDNVRPHWERHLQMRDQVQMHEVHSLLNQEGSV